ncbi:MAG: SagB/ThcOx family dehydrogenase [Ignavibacteriales bacterium]|nr:SagB/ThcOx family dehydrogenase [Ignavibacteriales bacterium]
MRTIILSLFFCIGVFFSSLSAQDAAVKQLPPPQTGIGKPLMQALLLRQSTRSFASTPLPLQELSNLLWAADGINRVETGKRTSPSAMNWQEMDVYVILADGAFLYNAKKHELEKVAGSDLRGAAGSQAFVRDAPVNFVYVADYAKVTRGSDEDKTLYTAADAGFIAQNVYLYCASQTLGVVVRGSVDRTALARGLQLRPDQKIILAQTIGYIK